MWRTSYSAMVSAESWIRSATSSMVLISEWICSRSIGVMKVLWISRLTSCVTRSAARSALSTSWLYLSRRCGIVVVGHQLRKGPRGLDDAVGMLVEHFEKIAFARQQLAKQHGSS
jgi:hypothetical protein